MKRSGSGTRSSTFGSLGSRISARLSAKLPTGAAKEIARGGGDTIALKNIPEAVPEANNSWKKGGLHSPSTAVDTEWQRMDRNLSRRLHESGKSLDDEDRASSVFIDRDIEDGLRSPPVPETRLSPPPRRR